MPTEHHDNKSQGIITSVEPATLINVKVVEIEKRVEVPDFVKVKVEKPFYVKKEFIKYNRKDEDTIFYIKKEEPTTKYIKKEEPTIFYVKKEEPYVVKVPVPNEVPYDIPVVSMTKVNDLASQAVSTLDKAKDMLKEINAAIMLLSDTIANVKETIPEEIKLPKIKYEEITVKDVKIIPETVRVIGKIVAREA